MLMTITRRVCLAGALASGLIPIAAAQTGWPARPIKILVPYAAGGNSDVVARIAGQYLQESLGVAVVIENRTGAGGLVATEAVARALDAMARDPAIQKRMIEVGSIAVSTTPQAFAQMIAVEGERWSKLVKQAGIKLQ